MLCSAASDLGLLCLLSPFCLNMQSKYGNMIKSNPPQKSSRVCLWVYFQYQGVWLVLVLLCFIENPVFNANRIDPDQMLHSAKGSYLEVIPKANPGRVS